MRPSIRALVVVGLGAVWLLAFLASASVADIVDPSSPYSAPQPKVLPSRPPARPVGVAASPAPSAEAPPAASSAPVVHPIPAEAPQLQQAPAHVKPRTASRSTRTEGSAGEQRPFEPIVQIVKDSVHTVGVFLDEVASACKVGVATGTGGPVLVFAVLGMAAALDRRRVLHARGATDEDVPELLYAGDVIAPG